MMGHPLPPKKEVALALLERGSVYIHLDPRATGVVVPAWFKKQPRLVLQVGLNMPVPIPDLHLDEDGTSCTLSFNRSPFFCVLPWEAVYALIGEDSRGMVWPDDVPREIALQAESHEAEATAKQPATARSRLAVVKPQPVPARKAPSKAKAARAERPEGAAAPKPRKPRAKKAPPAVAAEPLAPTAPAVRVVEAAPPAGQKPASPPRDKRKREIPPYLRVVK